MFLYQSFFIIHPITLFSHGFASQNFEYAKKNWCRQGIVIIFFRAEMYTVYRFGSCRMIFVLK